MKSPYAWCGVGAIGLVYASLALIDIRVPGVYYDELIQVVPALDFVRGGLWSATGGIAGSDVVVLGRSFALMTMAYMGALKTVLFVPVVAVAGISPESIRFTTVAIGAAALLVTFVYARRLLGIGAALLCAALLATDPSFTYYVRVDYGPTALMMLLKAVALWQLLAWWQHGHLRSLALGCFALGLGVYDKANFLWIIVAIGIAALVTAPRQLLRRATWQVGAISTASFAAGAAPLIWFNARWQMPTLAAVSEQGGPSGGFLDQLFERLGVLEHLLDGEYLARGATLLTPTANALVVLVIVSTLVVFVQVFKQPLLPLVRARMFLVLATAGTVVAAAATPGGFAGHHLILTYPFPHLLVASTIVDASQRVVVRSAMAALIGGVALVQSWTISMAHLRSLEASGGTGNFSDAIYDATEALEAEPTDAPVVSLDWGLHMPLVALSQGDLRGVELLNGSPQDFQEYFRDPNTRYVVHAPGATNSPSGGEAFAHAASVSGLQPVRNAEFSTRDGQPVIDVYVLQRVNTPTATVDTTALNASPRELALGPDDLGTANVTWNAGDSVNAEVWVSANDEPEHLFARAAKGSDLAPWIKAPGIYTFRLYSGSDRATVLAMIRVTAELTR